MRPRELTRTLRWTLLFSALLVFVTGLQLFVFADRTDRYFAWTIRPPLTAAFLGASYWGASVMLTFAARERLWANARIAVPAVLTFVPLMLLATFIHLDRFHLGAGTTSARVAGWGWLSLYVAVVAVVPVGLIAQWRVRGRDEERGEPLPPWLRALLGLHATVAAPLGIALYLAPTWADAAWFWPLAPLSARAVGAWLLTIAVLALHACLENDRRRVRLALIGYAVFGVLQLIALARFSGDVDWSDPRSWVFAALLASTVAAPIVLVGRRERFVAAAPSS
jgi:hypothetical protein